MKPHLVRTGPGAGGARHWPCGLLEAAEWAAAVLGRLLDGRGLDQHDDPVRDDDRAAGRASGAAGARGGLVTRSISREKVRVHGERACDVGRGEVRCRKRHSLHQDRSRLRHLDGLRLGSARVAMIMTGMGQGFGRKGEGHCHQRERP
jgi:hypothetical protein